jgi:hypothetical protein
MVNMLASSAIYIVGSSPDQDKPKTMKLVFVASPLSSIQVKERRLVGSESGKCVRVKRHVYPGTVVSVSLQSKNLTKRVCLDTKQTSSSFH